MQDVGLYAVIVEVVEEAAMLGVEGRNHSQVMVK